jgi:hypothetical protein
MAIFTASLRICAEVRERSIICPFQATESFQISEHPGNHIDEGKGSMSLFDCQEIFTAKCCERGTTDVQLAS